VRSRPRTYRRRESGSGKVARTRNDAQYALMREKIAKAAVKQFRTKGYQITTLDDIANSVGVTKAAIYYYFSKKSDILLEICSQALNQALSALDALDPTKSPDEKLRETLASHVRFMVDNLEAWTVFFQEIDLRKESKARQIVADQRRFARVMEDILTEGMDAGVFRRVDPELATLAILGMYNWVYRWYRSSGRTTEEVIDQFANMVEFGLMVRSPESADRIRADSRRAKLSTSRHKQR
jgi:TetR/AcrR family transcriptional regulator, cholesterol catabolism regulator